MRTASLEALSMVRTAALLLLFSNERRLDSAAT
jgi:hypothetical protein